MDPVHDRGSMDPVHESGPWTRSKVGVHGPLVHVLSSPHIGCFREFRKSARIGNSFLVLLGCPFGRYDLGTTENQRSPRYCSLKLVFVYIPYLFEKAPKLELVPSLE